MKEKTGQAPEGEALKTEQTEVDPPTAPAPEPEAPAEPETTIVVNSTEGYGYSYASLADMARAGVKIPKMRICREHPDYLEWWDGREWQLGAKIVQLPIKSMNAAQAYGAALTYARRYTTQMAMCVACGDDAGVENTKADGSTKTMADVIPSGAKKKGSGLDFGEVRAAIKKCESLDDLRAYWAGLTLSRKQEESILPAFLARKNELGGQNE